MKRERKQLAAVSWEMCKQIQMLPNIGTNDRSKK